MNALKTHGEKIMFVVILLVCGVYVLLEALNDTESERFKAVKDSQERLVREISAQNVSPQYPYGGKAGEAIAVAKHAMTANTGRVSQALDGIPQFGVYPRPGRPVVDQRTKPLTEDERTKIEYAELGELSDVVVRGDHGRIFVTYRLPKSMKLMEVVRVEIFRGEAADKIDTKAPYGTTEYNPEEAAPAAEEKPGTQPKAVAPPPKEMSSGERRRMERGDDPKDIPGEKEPKKNIEIPPEYQGVRVYQDIRVEPKKTYHYQVRLVARMTVPVGKREEREGRITVYQPPKDSKPLPPKTGSTATLFATGLSKTVSAASPSNFEIRLAGTRNEISTPDIAEHKRNRDYKGRFAVNVWVTDAKEWKEITIEAAPDEALKGTIFYKSEDSKENKSYNFEAGYTLTEIRMVETTREVFDKVAVLDPVTGDPVMDPKERKPLMAERKREVKALNEVAFLKDHATGKIEEFPKRNDYEKREKAIEFYKKILEQDEAERKAKKEAVAAALAKRKTEQPGAGGPPGGGPPAGPPPGGMPPGYQQPPDMGDPNVRPPVR